MFDKFPFFHQHDALDCGPSCLRMIAQHYGKKYSLETLRKKTFISKEGVSLLSISKAAENIGFRTKGVRITPNILSEKAPLPCILHWQQEHFIVVYKIQNNKYYIADPAVGKIVLHEHELKKGWLEGNEESGICLLLEPSSSFYKKETDTSKKLKLNFIFNYLKPYKFYLFQLLLGLILGSLIQLVFPFLTQILVDKGILLQNINFVYLILAGQLFFILSNTIVDYIRRWILLHISTRINISILADFLTKLMQLPLGFFDSKIQGDLFQRIEDHQRIENFLTSSLLSILFTCINILIFGSVLFYYNPIIFGIFLIGSLLYVGWISLFLKKRKEIDYKKFIEEANNQSNIYQIITGIQEIKLNNYETEKRWEWEKIQSRIFNIGVKGLEIEQIQQVGATTINEIKNALITFIAAKLVIDGNITLGIMLSIQYINGQLNTPLKSLVDFIFSLQDSKIAMERIGEIHTKKTEKELVENPIYEIPNNSIHIKNVSFRYGDPYSRKVLNNISLTIPKGKTTAIVGTSGSGKTTLIKLLLGFYPPEEGSIYIGNTPLQNLSLENWRNKCGVVMQDGFIFNDTIANNIIINKEQTNSSRLKKASSIANIEDEINKLPLKFNTKIGSDGRAISGGQKQRILIARAVYKNPDYIFFDEATNSLDTFNEKKIVENLHLFLKQKTVLVVAHRLSTVKNADQIVVLDKGEIIETGNHYELIAQKGAYYTLVKNQLELERA